MSGWLSWFRVNTALKSLGTNYSSPSFLQTLLLVLSYEVLLTNIEIVYEVLILNYLLGRSFLSRRLVEFRFELVQTTDTFFCHNFKVGFGLVLRCNRTRLCLLWLWNRNSWPDQLFQIWNLIFDQAIKNFFLLCWLLILWRCGLYPLHCPQMLFLQTVVQV